MKHSKTYQGLVGNGDTAFSIVEVEKGLYFQQANPSFVCFFIYKKDPRIKPIVGDDVACIQPINSTQSLQLPQMRIGYPNSDVKAVCC